MTKLPRPFIDILTVVAHIILYAPKTYTAYNIECRSAADIYLTGDYMEDDSPNMKTLRFYPFSAHDWQNTRNRMCTPDYVMPRA